MSIGLMLKESMSGWIKFHDQGERQFFSFSIAAFTTQIFSLRTPRAFNGQVAFGDSNETTETTGSLTLYPMGPRYQMHFTLKDYGALYLEGKKRYSITDLKRTLTTCPMTVYKEGKAVGIAEVIYRDSMVAFPFKALTLMKEDKAWQR